MLEQRVLFTGTSSDQWNLVADATCTGGNSSSLAPHIHIGALQTVAGTSLSAAEATAAANPGDYIQIVDPYESLTGLTDTLIPAASLTNPPYIDTPSSLGISSSGYVLVINYTGTTTGSTAASGVSSSGFPYAYNPVYIPIHFVPQNNPNHCNCDGNMNPAIGAVTLLNTFNGSSNAGPVTIPYYGVVGQGGGEVMFPRRPRIPWIIQTAL